MYVPGIFNYYSTDINKIFINETKRENSNFN